MSEKIKNVSFEPWHLDAIVRQTRRLLLSFARWTGHELFSNQGTEREQACALFETPFVVVAHGTEPDPILNYGNRAALSLWEMDWAEFTRTPSRLTAEQEQREERARLLAEAARKGFFADYRGVRISRSGKRFLIEEAIVWNVLDEAGRPAGQAATFSQWRYLDKA